MIVIKEPWKLWEKEIQERWGLDSTPRSGARFQDPGDAVDHSSPHDNGFRLEVDCKDTAGKNYTLFKPFLKFWSDRAAERGKRFVLAVRFREKDQPNGEYVVLGIDDFEELLEKARKYESGHHKILVDRTWIDQDEYRRGV